MTQTDRKLTFASCFSVEIGIGHSFSTERGSRSHGKVFLSTVLAWAPDPHILLAVLRRCLLLVIISLRVSTENIQTLTLQDKYAYINYLLKSFMRHSTDTYAASHTFRS